MLALFESSAHPQYSPGRAALALGYLDNIIRRQLMTLDTNDSDVSSFKPHRVPSVKTTEGSLSEMFVHPTSAECPPWTRSLLFLLVLCAAMGFFLEPC